MFQRIREKAFYKRYSALVNEAESFFKHSTQFKKVEENIDIMGFQIGTKMKYYGLQKK